MSAPTRLAVLISGEGRTLQNLLDRIDDGRLSAKVEIVVSSRRSAVGLERAAARGIPTRVIERKSFRDAESFSREMTWALDSFGFDLLIMAGFMSLYLFPEKWAGKVLNIHPGLLPDFGGKGLYGDRVHQAVLKAGTRESGCTVHFADHQYDHGPVILERRVPVLPDDTPESLAKRVFDAECEAYPAAIAKVAADGVTLEAPRN